MLLFQSLPGWLASLALLTLFSLVAANPPAHSLEKTGFYLIYRNAITAYGVKQKKIAPELRKDKTLSHPDGGANYREFINHIGNTAFTDAQLTAAGVDLNDPNLESATKFLLANTDSKGKKGSGQVISQKLRPYATGPNAPKSFKYFDQIAKMEKVHEKSYAKMTADKRDTGVLDGNRDKLVELLKEVDVVRKSDTLSSQPGSKVVKGLVADIGKLIPGAKLELDDSAKWKWDNSRTIFTVDLAETLKQSTAGVFEDVKAVSKAVRSYGSTESSAKYDPAYTHYRTHKAFRKMRKTIKPKKSC